IELAGTAAILDQEADKRRHPDTLVAAGPEERLNPHWITNTNQFLLLAVPNDQREDAFQSSQAVGPKLVVKTEQEFGVILTFTTRQEKVDEFFDVVEFTCQDGSARSVRLEQHDVIFSEQTDLGV